MTAYAAPVRRTLLTLAKIALAVAILAYLLHQAREHDAFTQLVEQPKHWNLLAAGLVCTLISILLSFVRWHLFIRAVGIPIRLLDSLRLGALGFALNFVSLGAVGGDLFKAFFLAHGQPGLRTEAVVSVLADRVAGLMTILALATGGILATDLTHRAPPPLVALCHAILLAAAVVFCGAAAALFVPPLSGERVLALTQRLPFVGGTLARLLGAVATYRNQKRALAAAAAVSVAGNLTYITAFYLVASGLPIQRPSYAEHFVVVPVANMVGAIPATPSGLGTKEAAVDLMYRTMPSGTGVVRGTGTMVTLAHRLTEVAGAALGLLYYLTHRKEVEEVYHEAEEFEEERGLS